MAQRRIGFGVALVLAIVLALVPPVAAKGNHGHDHRGRSPRAPGMVWVASEKGFEDTWDELVTALDNNPNINVVATIDHAAAAASVGLELDPNRVVVFGNPALGSPLMQINRTVGIDLPQKIQVIERGRTTWVGFNDTTYLQARHDLGDAPTLDTIAGALRALTSVATGVEVGTDMGTFGTRRFARNNGLITVASDADVDRTWDRLLAAIDASPANVAFTVDHEAGATSVGLDLPPTKLVVFGNPQLGTPLMQRTATAGIDLPLKFLVWEDSDGSTYVTTNGVALARRHRVPRRHLDAVGTAVGNFLTAATITP